jgi:hypothetical protein
MTKPRVDRITVPCDDGDVEASRNRDGSWHIGYPWGDEDFFGTIMQVKARMLRKVLEVQKADAIYQQQQESSP